MLQVVDKTLGVSFCKTADLCNSAITAIHVLITFYCSQQPAQLIALHAGHHWRRIPE